MLQSFGKTRNIIFISALIFCADLLVVLANHQKLNNDFDRNLTDIARQHHVNYRVTLEQTYSSLRSLATYIASDDEISNLFYQASLAQQQIPRDTEKLAQLRDELNNKLARTWSNLQKTFYARQLHFHFGPGSTSFLRVHKPEKFGDSLDSIRHTIVYANTHKVPVEGFETGRIYSGFRSVLPLYYRQPETGFQIHTGALETGASLGSVFEVLSETLQVNAGVLLTQAHAEENMWPEAIKEKFSGLITNGCDCYIEEATANNVEAIIQAALADQINLYVEGGERIQLGDQQLFISHFPLYDFKTLNDGSNAAVGSVFFWKNIDPLVAELNRSIFYTYVVGLLGFVFVQTLLLIGMRVASNQLKHVIKQQMQDISKTVKELNKAQKIAKTGSWYFNIRDDELEWSEMIYEIFEIPHDVSPITYELFMSRVHPDDRDLVDQAFQHSLETQTSYGIIHRLQMQDGRIKYVQERGISQYDATGEPLSSSGTVTDITEEYILNEQNRLAQKVFEHASEAILIADAHIRIVDVNPAFTAITGFAKEEVIGETPDFMRSSKHDESFYAEIWQDLQTNGFWQGEIWNQHKSGESYPEWLTISVIRNHANQIEHYIILFIDISERKQFESQLINIAHHDQLTGLLNRNCLREQLEQAQVRADRVGKPMAVVFIDLDGFKAINDECGHDAGDSVLVAVAERIQRDSRQSDSYFRLGGDEFLVVYNEVADLASAKKLAKKILAAISEPILFNEQSFQIAASIGVRFYRPLEEVSVEQLVKDADAAMYKAKHSGKNHISLYTAE